MKPFEFGYKKDPIDVVMNDLRFRPWKPQQGEAPGYLIQKYAWIQDQKRMPSCVGHAVSACINASEEGKPNPRYASAVSIWKDARRIEGNLSRMVGTYLVTAIQLSIARRGVSPYRQGEEDNLDSALIKDDLDAELDASDRIIIDGKRFRIYDSSRVEDIVFALNEGKFVVFGALISEYYMEHNRNDASKALSTREIGCSKGVGGHAQRIAGYRMTDGRIDFLVQNSWGESWGGALLDDGTVRNGCAWVNEDAICSSYCWDFHVMDLDQ
jgi:hypothetical protein